MYMLLAVVHSRAWDKTAGETEGTEAEQSHRAGGRGQGQTNDEKGSPPIGTG